MKTHMQNKIRRIVYRANYVIPTTCLQTIIRWLILDTIYLGQIF